MSISHIRLSGYITKCHIFYLFYSLVLCVYVSVCHRIKVTTTFLFMCVCTCVCTCVCVGYHLPFWHNELVHLPYMAVALIPVESRSRSIWWQIDFGLDLSGCWVALWPAVLSGRGSGRVCLGAWGFPTASGGLSPRLLLPSGRFGLSPGAWGALNKGNADGAVGIFGNSGRVWATALRPVPPKKRPCAILSRKVGRPTNIPVLIILVTNWFRAGPLQVLGSTLAGRVIGTRFGRSVSRCLGISYGLRGPSPQAFTPFGEVWFIARRLRRP